MKKVLSFLISFMLLVSPLTGVLADGEIVVKNEEDVEVLTFDEGQEVVITSGTGSENDVKAGEYTVEGKDDADIHVENKSEGLSVQDPDKTGEALIVESNVDIKSEGDGWATGNGINAGGNVVVIENGDVEADGKAVKASDDAVVLVNGTLTAGTTGVEAKNSSVVVDPAGNAEAIFDKIDEAETVDDLKGIMPEKKVTAVDADQTGIRAANGAGVGVMGDVVVDTKYSSSIFGVDTRKIEDRDAPVPSEASTDDTQVLVAGDVTVKVKPETTPPMVSATGINVGDRDNDSNVLVLGDVDVTVTGTSAHSATGISARSQNGVSNKAVTVVIGDVKATADGDSTYANADGVYAFADDKKGHIDVGVGGDVTATGKVAERSNGNGYDGSVNAVEAWGNVNVEIDGSAKAISSNGETRGVNGVYVDSGYYDTTVTVGENVETLGTGINVRTKEDGVASVHVGADVNGGTLDGETSEADTGILLNFAQGQGDVNVIVEGTITAEDAIKINVPVNNDSEVELDADKINIQVWKIEAGEEVVQSRDEELAKKVEENIQYILRVTQPTGGNIAVSGEGVNQFENAINEKSAFTAKAGTDVIISLRVDPGYELSDVTGGTAVVTKTGDCMYSLVVPSLGGVDIQAIIRAILQDSGDSWERTAAAVRADLVMPETAGTDSAAISAEDAVTLSHYSPEQQVAIILTKIGMNDALASSGIRIKDLARKAAEGITSDLSSLVTEEELTIDGETAVWKVISLMENGKLVKYCFRQLEDGTWVFMKI